MADPDRKRRPPWLPDWAKLLGFLGSLLIAAMALGWMYLQPGVSPADDHRVRRWKSVIEREPSRETLALEQPPYPRPPSEDAPIPQAAPNWKAPHVAVYSVPTLTPPHPKPTLRDLADSGQAHAIDFLAKTSTATAWPSLQQALVDASESVGEKDPFRFDRVLVATVTKGSDWLPGDRMVWTKVFVQPINFEFEGYTVAATENATVKVTSFEATTTHKVSTEFGLAILGVEGAKASVAPSNEHTVKTSGEINTHFERLGIDIKADFLRIIRESESGGDAVGNTTIALSTLTDPKTIEKKYPRDEGVSSPEPNFVLVVTNAKLLDDKAADLDHTQAALTVLPQIQLPHCALKARVWMLYERRHILRGGEFYDEAEQDVSLDRDADIKKDVEVVRADDVSPAVWSIQIFSNKKEEERDSKAPAFLSGRIDTGRWRELAFTDYSLASKVALWMRSHPGETVSGLNFSNSAGESLYPVKTIGDECTDRTKTRAIYHLAAQQP